eukprot:5578101-Pyramimonas_sp.AAC.1
MGSASDTSVRALSPSRELVRWGHLLTHPPSRGLGRLLLGAGRGGAVERANAVGREQTSGMWGRARGVGCTLV